jgi:hypothetical protein
MVKKDKELLFLIVKKFGRQNKRREKRRSEAKERIFFNESSSDWKT